MTHQSRIQQPGPDRDARIRDAQNAVIARMRQNPEKARSTLCTTGSIGEGLTCRVTQGPFQAVLDLGTGMGGDCAGPSPGFFARAAIVGCVGMAVKMLAAREGLRFHSVDVAVEMDFDDAALFGVGSGNAAPVDTRILVQIVSDEDEAQAKDIVDRALAMDPWFLALRDPQKVSASVRTYQVDGKPTAGI